MIKNTKLVLLFVLIIFPTLIYSQYSPQDLPSVIADGEEKSVDPGEYENLMAINGGTLRMLCDYKITQLSVDNNSKIIRTRNI